MTNYIFILLVTFSFQVNAQISKDELYPDTNLGNHLIKKNYLSYSYSNDHKQSEWIFYRLTRNMMDGSFKRLHSFLLDKRIQRINAVISKDYQGTGYDRGHLMPAADIKSSLQGMRDTFYLSNISPQLPLFNRGIWKSLEMKTRRWVKTNGTIYIYTGPVLLQATEAISEREISIPTAFYKIIIQKTKDSIRSISFLIPHTENYGNLESYITNVDTIEDLTGINFMKKIDKKLQDRVESEYNSLLWFNPTLY